MRLPTTICLLGVVLLGAGCASILQSYPRQSEDFYAAYRQGRFEDAYSRLTRQAATGGKDGVLWQLETGAVARAAGRFQCSNDALGRAEALLEDFDARAVVSARDVGSEGAAVATNLNALPYRGTAADRIMLNTYKALNFVALGDSAAARVECRRAYVRQREALETYRKALDEAKTRDAALRNRLNDAYGPENYRPYADFVNPFTVWLDGVVFLHTSTDRDDLERAREDFARLADMVGDVPAVTADLAAAEARVRGQQPEPVVYVLLENGVAPEWHEWRLDLPIPSREVVYTAVALPRLAFQAAPVPDVAVAGSGAATRLLASMDAVVDHEFRLRLPGIVTRSLAGTAVKTTAQAAAQDQWGDWGQLGAVLLQAILTRADLRHWRTLPKEWQVLRLPRPASGELRLTAPSGPALHVVLPDAPAVLVFAKALDPGLVLGHPYPLRPQ